VRRPLRPRPSVAAYQQGARARLRRFRQGSTLAVALTALLLFLGGVPGETAGDSQPEVPVDAVAADPAVALEQAGGTLRELVLGFYAYLPKLAVALILLGFAWVIARIARSTLRRTLGQWERADAVSALATIAIYLGATVIAMSILAGDARALLGSVGLIGLALSWALQTPIESFTGWFLNSLRGYYRVGDRIEVGEVFGDVYRIDVLTTTVWEAGGPGKAVAGAQPTGAMITFPNWEVLRSNVVNYSREFPYVWDEVTVAIANESDLQYAVTVFEAVADRLVGDQMTSAAQQYQDLLERARIAFEVEERPRVFVSGADAWTNCTVRYLVHARKRRRLASDLTIALANVTSEPEHQGRIVPAYPRTEIKLRRTWLPVPPAERS
jgi:small-conductance mechanosensitive channel